MKNFYLVAILAALSFGCGGGDDPANPLANVAGTWTATMTTTGGTALPPGTQFLVEFVLAQNGQTFGGTYETQGGNAGAIGGVVNGSTLAFDATQGGTCPGGFHGAGTASGDALTGTYSGADCNGSVEATFTATRGGGA